MKKVFLASLLFLSFGSSRAQSPISIATQNKPSTSDAHVTSTITGTTSACVGASSTLSCSLVGGSWSSSNTAIAVVGASTGEVTGVSAGSTTIHYTEGSNSASTGFTVTNCSASGVAEYCRSAREVYPNPANAELNIPLSYDLKAVSRVIILNLVGQVVYDNLCSDTDYLKINTSNWKPGTYFIKVSFGRLGYSSQVKVAH